MPDRKQEISRAERRHDQSVPALAASGWGNLLDDLLREVAGNLLVAEKLHSELPAPAGDRSLHVRRAMFAAQLDVLASACDVVSLDTIVTASAPRAHAAGRPGVAVKPSRASTEPSSPAIAATIAAGVIASKR